MYRYLFCSVFLIDNCENRLKPGEMRVIFQIFVLIVIYFLLQPATPMYQYCHDSLANGSTGPKDIQQRKQSLHFICAHVIGSLKLRLIQGHKYAKIKAERGQFQTTQEDGTEVQAADQEIDYPEAIVEVNYQKGLTDPKIYTVSN